MRYMITDELWTTMGPLVEQAKRYKCGAPPELPERVFFEAALYIARTGITWRDLQGEFGDLGSLGSTQLVLSAGDGLIGVCKQTMVMIIADRREAIVSGESAS